MTYQVLARKWRPRTFEQLVGQDHIRLALEHALKTNRLHHAYLFSGTRGVGKTTIARILAKCLNCEQGMSAQPCGQCAACTGVDAGRFADLIEVDAASRTKVEDTRELLDNVMYAPTSGRYKIYLIDEVHMLSGHSFNALLKTLEEPPPHVIFLLATTDPQKLPITVLSRCLQFQLRPIAFTVLQQQLTHILNEEGIAFEQAAIDLISQSAHSSMRDALSLLEQAIAIGQGKVTEASTQQMLGCTYMALLPDLLKAICAQETNQALTVIEQLYLHGSDFYQLLDAMLATFHAWAVAQALPGEAKAMADFAGVSQAVVGLYQDQSPEQIQLYYEIALKGKQELMLAPSAKVGFEMICLRLMHFRPFTEQAMQQGVATPAVKPSQPKPTQTQAAPAVAPRPTRPQPVASQVRPTPKPATAPMPKQQMMPPPSPHASASSQTKAPSGQPDWAEVAQKLQLVGLAKVLVQNCVVSQWDLPTVKLILDGRQSVVLNAEREAKIEKALSSYLKQPINLTIVAGDTQQQSPKQQAETAQAARQSRAEQLLQQDKDAQKLIQAFDATVEQVKLNDDKERS